MDTEVLEAIIKDDAVDPTCLEDVPTEPVSIHPDRHDGEDNVARSGRTRPGTASRSCASDTAAAARGWLPAAAQYGHPSPCLQQPLGDLNHQRRLSVPPTVRLPMLITGTGRCLRANHPRSYRRRAALWPSHGAAARKPPHLSLSWVSTVSLSSAMSGNNRAT